MGEMFSFLPEIRKMVNNLLVIFFNEKKKHKNIKSTIVLIDCTNLSFLVDVLYMP